MSRPMPLCMCVEVSDWVKMSPADQCMQTLRRQHKNGNDEQHSIFAASTQRFHVKTATHILPERRHQEYLNGDTQLTQNCDSLD